jgi:amidase
VGSYANESLHVGRTITPQQLDEANSVRARRQVEVIAAFDEVDVLALPTLIAAPPMVTGFRGFPTGLAFEQTLASPDDSLVRRVPDK